MLPYFLYGPFRLDRTGTLSTQANRGDESKAPIPLAVLQLSHIFAGFFQFLVDSLQLVHVAFLLFFAFFVLGKKISPVTSPAAIPFDLCPAADVPSCLTCPTWQKSER